MAQRNLKQLMLADSKRKQTIGFYSRSRRKSLRDPAHELFQTHSFAYGDRIDPSESFADYTKPITFAFTLRRTSSGTFGMIFEIGSTERGAAMAISNGSIIVCAGADTNENVDGVTFIATNALPKEDVEYHVVVSIRPETGTLIAWVDGKEIGRAVAPFGNLGSGWTSDGIGEVGGLDGTVCASIFFIFHDPLNGAEFTSPFKVYYNQIPHHFR